MNVAVEPVVRPQRIVRVDEVDVGVVDVHQRQASWKRWPHVELVCSGLHGLYLCAFYLVNLTKLFANKLLLWISCRFDNSFNGLTPL